MENMNIRIEGQNEVREKAVHAFGLDQPDIFDTVSRDKFADDDSYIDALIQEQMKRQDPTYQEARRQLMKKYHERQEKERKAEISKFHEQARKDAKLDYVDIQNIDAEAASRAKFDLVNGKISASQLADKIEEYAEEMKKQKLETKANNAVMNAMFRGLL